ncbi:hypothetical protein [Curtobacterium sp. ISL-83]|uniref:hypothetical protein n=1 Tax=Curtobacterium sp. ISL-83 TaxID=2819145 RepID=UPI001BE4E9E5|nr:hypothetical protein [Curtobacterium sp. ISL-83]MBT2504079.1 hypothetical protein [Curtobacterium sp. ISL-83]
MHECEVSAEGEIDGVSGPWGEIDQVRAVALIESGAVGFYLEGARHRAVRVLHCPGRIVLYCNWDGSARNNLLDL